MKCVSQHLSDRSTHLDIIIDIQQLVLHEGHITYQGVCEVKFNH